jgi:hypothetical protein
MCGDHDDHDHEHDQLEQATYQRLIHLAAHYEVKPDASAGNTPVTLENEKMRTVYLDGLFRAALTRTVNDTAHITEGERLDILAGQSIVFARLAGLLAGLLPVESGQFQTVISAMMQGYNEPASLEHDH